MEASISVFCKTLAAFCNHVEASSQALSNAIQRRPIPLDSAASAFLQCLERRISSASADLDLLESMALGTVSFEELLGHCNEVYKINHRYISDLEDQLRSFGYVPEIELEDVDDEEANAASKFRSPINGSNEMPFNCGSVSAAQSRMEMLQEDQLFDDSISLQNLGLSDACLATLASGDNDCVASPILSSPNVVNPVDGQSHGDRVTIQPLENDLVSKVVDVAKVVIHVSKDDYDILPSYIKNLASWEELQEAVSKMNSYLHGKDGVEKGNALSQDDLETLQLGRKGRSYMLVLLRMNQLVLETVDGSSFYRVHAKCL